MEKALKSTPAQLANAKRQWAKATPERKAQKAASAKAWKATNPEKKRAMDKAWRDANRDRLALYRQRQKGKPETPTKRFMGNLRKRLRCTLKSKSMHTMEYVGCTPQFLRQHIESQFTKGMTWENYGQWHLDHIVPLSKFDLTDVDQQKRCNNWTNLQPLWAKDNLDKGDAW